ncbi:hypothetical protein ACLIYP_09430 [Streptomyces nanhaiensis]
MEWTARPGEVEPVGDDDAGGVPDALLRSRIAAANARSRGEML